MAEPLRGGEELVRQALGAAAARLATVSETPRLDAELMMAHALGVTRDALILRHLDAAVPAGFAALVERRLRHEPVAYITGARAFWTVDIAVGPGVLVPRPDSETLIEAAVAHFGAGGPARILDLGTGPGTLLLAGLDQWPGASGVGVDASAAALDYARANAGRLGLTTRASFFLGDWAAGIEGEFDLILANPPYIATHEALPAEVSDHEPHAALFAGEDGLDAYRVLAPQVGPLLAPGGVAAIEIGATQGAAVAGLFAAAGLRIEIRQDIAGRDRVVVATLRR